MTAEGEILIESIIRGNSVSEVLEYVQFKDRDLINRPQAAVEVAVRRGLIDYQEVGRFVRV